MALWLQFMQPIYVPLVQGKLGGINDLSPTVRHSQVWNVHFNHMASASAASIAAQTAAWSPLSLEHRHIAAPPAP